MLEVLYISYIHCMYFDIILLILPQQCRYINQFPLISSCNKILTYKYVDVVLLTVVSCLCFYDIFVDVVVNYTLFEYYFSVWEFVTLSAVVRKFSGGIMMYALPFHR